MARIFGVTLPSNKKVAYGLTAIYGIGIKSAHDIIRAANISTELRIKDLSEDQVNKIREIIEKHYKVEGELRREKLLNIKRLKEIGAYRGIRHIRGLPVRGQRTRTNSRTVRGNIRKTMGSGRKPPAQKT